MGLLGLARRAGAARGAFMMEQEMYNRGRQEMLDQMARNKAAQESALLRQRMANAAAGEQRAQAAFNSNQGWLSKERANTELGWKNAAADRALKLKNDAEDRALKLERDRIAAEQQQDLNDQQIEAQENQLEAYSRLTPQQQAVAQYPGLWRMAALDAGKYGVTAKGGTSRGTAAAGKPPISDSLLKANAETVTPERMQLAFNRKFYDTDAKIEARTGMKRDQFMKTLADQYRAHVLSARENAMDEDDFIRQAVGQYGFWDKHDLGRLTNAMRDTKKRHGFGWFGLARRNEEEEYARRNPAFYKQQKQMIGEIDNGVKAFTGKDDAALADSIKMNRNAVRIFDSYRKNGLSAGDAVIYAVLHDYAKRNNLDANAIIDNFRKHPGENKAFVQYVRKNGLDAALSKFNTAAFRRRQEIRQ